MQAASVQGYCKDIVTCVFYQIKLNKEQSINVISSKFPFELPH